LDALELLRFAPGTGVAGLAEPIEEITHTDDDMETAARAALREDVTVLPIGDREGRLVGILPIKDAARIIAEADEEDYALSGGTQPLYRRYLPTSILTIARTRIVWLLVLAISAVLTVHVLEIFESTLAEVVALALFIPLLTGIGGNTGSQAATTVTRALAMDEIGLRDFLRVAGKELTTGLLLGVLLAVPAFAIASPLYGIEIGAVIALTLTVNCPIAAVVGGSIPILAKASRVDPAVVSTRFISTFSDACGLLVYFTIAIALLGLRDRSAPSRAQQPDSAEAAGQLGPQLLVEAAPTEQPGHVPHRVVDLAPPDLDRGPRIRTGQRPEHRPVVADDAGAGRGVVELEHGDEQPQPQGQGFEGACRLTQPRGAGELLLEVQVGVLDVDAAARRCRGLDLPQRQLHGNQVALGAQGQRSQHDFPDGHARGVEVEHVDGCDQRDAGTAAGTVEQLVVDHPAQRRIHRGPRHPHAPRQQTRIDPIAGVVAGVDDLLAQGDRQMLGDRPGL